MPIAFKTDMVLASRYRLVQFLGNGKTTEVWHAYDTFADVNVALKFYLSETEGRKAIEKFMMLFNINHINILHSIYVGCLDGVIYEVMQYCKFGSIVKLLDDKTRIQEETCWKIMHDVAAGLACLHDQRSPILHLDIKPHNILVHDNGCFMITDFGISDYYSAEKKESGNGTPDYMAPERFQEENSPIKANDVWALGAMMYEIMTGGELPFGEMGGLTQSPSDAVPQIIADYSSELKQMVYRCLSFYPWDRPMAKEIVTLSHNKLSNKKHN